MSVPIRCSTCGDLVGVINALCIGMGGHQKYHRCTCPGKGNHTKSVRTETIFGWLWWKKRHVVIFYPETGTKSEYNEKFINGEWVRV